MNDFPSVYQIWAENNQRHHSSTIFFATDRSRKKNCSCFTNIELYFGKNLEHGTPYGENSPYHWRVINLINPKVFHNKSIRVTIASSD